MKEKHTIGINNGERTSHPKIVDVLLKIAAFFIILEPIWMLLPFAGFLYGSVMHIEFLGRNPYTSWLVHFVFPTHTFFPVGLILIVLGFAVFLVGAFQIYRAKFLKNGMVTNGIYKKFRHPQYLALTLFGIGILLTWGRFITFIAFFIMMWLYYFLSKSEERQCVELFGDAYKVYRKSTYFLFPGEESLFRLTRKIPTFNLPKWTVVTFSFFLVVATAVGSGFLIQEIRRASRNTIPVMEGSFPSSSEKKGSQKFLMVKGPALQAAPSKEKRDEAMQKIMGLMISSGKIRKAIDQFDLSDTRTLLVFPTPGSNWHSGVHGDYKTAKVNLFMVILQTPVPFTGSNFAEFSKNRQILKVIKAQDLSYERTKAGQDPVAGEVTIMGPAPGMVNQTFEDKMEERIDFFLSGL